LLPRSSDRAGESDFKTGFEFFPDGHIATGSCAAPYCKSDRARAGVSVNWSDPQDRGFHLAFFDVDGTPVDGTPCGPDDFGVGKRHGQ
jgi:hypothetical protein